MYPDKNFQSYSFYLALFESVGEMLEIKAQMLCSKSHDKARNVKNYLSLAVNFFFANTDVTFSNEVIYFKMN